MVTLALSLVGMGRLSISKIYFDLLHHTVKLSNDKIPTDYICKVFKLKKLAKGPHKI